MPPMANDSFVSTVKQTTVSIASAQDGQLYTVSRPEPLFFSLFLRREKKREEKLPANHRSLIMARTPEDNTETAMADAIKKAVAAAMAKANGKSNRMIRPCRTMSR
jgi:hypothetical protein